MDSSSTSKQPKKDGLLVEEVADQQQHQPVAITAPTAKAKKGKYTLTPSNKWMEFTKAHVD